MSLISFFNWACTQLLSQSLFTTILKILLAFLLCIFPYLRQLPPFFFNLFFLLFTQYILSAPYVPGIVLGVMDREDLVIMSSA